MPSSALPRTGPWMVVASMVLPSACARAGVVFDDLGTYVTDQDSAAHTAGFVFGFGVVDETLIDEGLSIFSGRLRRA